MTTILIVGALWVLVSFVFCLAICMAATKPMPAMDPQEEIILAIDDDTEILNLTKLALDGEGYSVHTASSPEEGIRFYAEHWESIKLVLLDFLMPKMTGDRVYECLREIDPGVPVLLVTGYYDRIPANSLRNGVCGYLAKPFHLDDLILQVRNAVNLRLHRQTSNA